MYEQPPIPAEGYLWTPGYWAYGDEGYYWVPGTWVQPPSVGVLWTPGYWGWNAGAYVFHGGYWGPHIGFYGGINYGFGYGGVGYEGGRWDGDKFAYNRSVNNISNTNITNVYNKTVINTTTVNNVSYNGGSGGVPVKPTPEEESVAHEQHVAPTPVQAQHEQAAKSNKALLASVNQGKPPIAATSKPAELTGKGVVPAKAAGTVPKEAAEAARPPREAANPATTPANPAGEVAKPAATAPKPAAQPAHPAQHPAAANPAPHPAPHPAAAYRTTRRHRSPRRSTCRRRRQSLAHLGRNAEPPGSRDERCTGGLPQFADNGSRVPV